MPEAPPLLLSGRTSPSDAFATVEGAVGVAGVAAARRGVGGEGLGEAGGGATVGVAGTSDCRAAAGTLVG